MHLLEIYDIEGNMTRKGYIEKGQSIRFQEGDYSYIVREDSYPFNVLNEGLFSRKKKEEKCQAKLVEDIGNSVEISFNRKNKYDFFIDGRHIKIFNGDKAFVEKTTGKMQFKKDGETILSFFCDTSDVKESILGTGISDEQLNIATMISEGTGETIYEQLMNINSIDSYLLLKQFELKFNSRQKSINGSSWELHSGIQITISSNNEIDEIEVFYIEKSELIFSERKRISEPESYLLTYPGKPIFIKGYKNGVFVSSRIGSKPSEKLNSDVRDILSKERSDYLSIIEKGMLIQEEYAPAVNDIIRFQKSIPVDAYLVDAPICKIEQESLMSVKCQIDLLKEIPKMFYLVFSEDKDVMSVRKSFRMTLDREYTEIEKNDLLNHSILYCWIEDESQKRVSPVRTTSWNDTHEETIMEIENIMIQEDNQHIFDVLTKINTSQGHVLYTKLIESINDEVELSQKDKWTILLCLFMENKVVHSNWPYMQELLKERKRLFGGAGMFFSEPVTYRGAENLVLVSSQREHLCIKRVFSRKTQSTTCEFLREVDSVSLTDELTWLEWIDCRTYEKSGSLFIQDKRIVGSFDMEMKVIN